MVHSEFANLTQDTKPNVDEVGCPVVSRVFVYDIFCGGLYFQRGRITKQTQQKLHIQKENYIEEGFI